jgi:toxin ParE1/3/4
MRLELHADAREEFLDAVSHYDGAAPGLGTRYVRRLVSGGDFPYSVIYALRDDAIFVVAFAHGARRPGYWRNRIVR